MNWFRFIAGERGNVVVGTALMAAPLMMAVGAATDLANINRVKSDVQAALDAAGMEIAVNVASGKSDAELEALGRQHFHAHLKSSSFHNNALPAFRYNGLISDNNGMQHISAESDYSYKMLFGGAFRKDDGNSWASMDYRRETQISVTIGDTACVYALNRSAPRAIEAAGNTAITMEGCVIASNSSASDAIYVGGSASLEADCLQSSGGIDATGGLVTDCQSNRTNAWPLPDPFASLIEPAPPPLLNNPKKKDTTVSPGRYIDLDLDGTKQLQPGLYYIEGSLSIKGDVSGTGIVFFMKDGGVTVNGSASLTLSAPQTGDYAGMLFMSAKTNSSAHLFNGNGATDLNGYLYFPAGDLSYTGNNGTTSNCLRIVADTVKMSGSSILKSDCSDELGGREARVSGPLHFTR